MEPIVVIEILVGITLSIRHACVTSVCVITGNAPVRWRLHTRCLLLMLCTILLSRLAASITLAVLRSLMTISIRCMIAMGTRGVRLLIM